MFVSLCVSTAALGAIPIQQAGVEKKNHYIQSGVIVGGRDQGPVELVNVRHSYDSGKKLERLVLDVSPEQKDVSSERPGFFHVALQKRKDGKGRLVIELENVASAKVNEHQVSNLLASKSHYFAAASFYRDEDNGDLTIEIPLKSPAQLEVFELSSSERPGRIVIDAKGI